MVDLLDSEEYKNEMMEDIGGQEYITGGKRVWMDEEENDEIKRFCGEEEEYGFVRETNTEETIDLTRNEEDHWETVMNDKNFADGAKENGRTLEEELRKVMSQISTLWLRKKTLKEKRKIEEIKSFSKQDEIMYEFYSKN